MAGLGVEAGSGDLRLGELSLLTFLSSCHHGVRPKRGRVVELRGFRVGRRDVE